MWNQMLKHYYFRCSRPTDVNGIKSFDKDYQAIKHFSFILMFCRLVIFIKHFDSINIRRSWASEITMFCSEFTMTKVFKPIKIRRHWPPIWFHIFSTWYSSYIMCTCGLPNIYTLGGLRVYSIDQANHSRKWCNY